MLYTLAALLTAVAFVVLLRLLWLKAQPSRSTTVITVAAAVLIIGLVVLAATGRLHWLAALVAGIVPFLRRILGLVSYLPWVGRLFAGFRQARASAAGDQAGARAARAGAMTPEEAREILNLGSNPTRDEVIAAHRRLMQKLHPDHGGSTYLAQQLNEAKRVLLKRGH